MSKLTDKIQELVNQYGYDAQVLTDFATYAQTLPKINNNKKDQDQEALTISQLKKAVCDAFGCKDYQELKKNKAFKLATDAREFNLKMKKTWLILYREWVGGT